MKLEILKYFTLFIKLYEKASDELANPWIVVEVNLIINIDMWAIKINKIIFFKNQFDFANSDAI
jgi:hypothetical protein